MNIEVHECGWSYMLFRKLNHLGSNYLVTKIVNHPCYLVAKLLIIHVILVAKSRVGIVGLLR
jgi:hypothetical protein